MQSPFKALLSIIAAVGILNTACASTEIVAAADAAETGPVLTIGNPDKFSNDSPTVLITGSNRGIGLEFTKQFAARGWNIIATTRDPADDAELQEIAKANDRVVIEQLDVTDYDRLSVLTNKYGDRAIDLLLSNAGITPKYGTAFKTVSGVDWDMARLSNEVNAIAPVRLAQAFMGQVAASDMKKIVVISSKAGSFELSPEMPMMYSYRGSKALLNMYMYTLSFETAKRGVTLTLLSPGQVNTTPGFKLPGAIETEESVTKMLAVIDSITPEQNGKFLDYEDGRVLGW